MRSTKRTLGRLELICVGVGFLAALQIVGGCTPAPEPPPLVASSEKSTDDQTASVTVADDASDDRYKKVRQVKDSLVIGLDADMSSGSAQAGIAIERGVILAVEEINSKGGLLGRPIELIVRDHRGNPDRGVDNIAEFCAMPDVLAVVGGLHTPVAIRELKKVHEHKMIYLGPWAAGTPVVENGNIPNYVFRVSVRDEYAGEFLVNRAVERGLGKVGLLLERTAWGRSSELAMQNALQDRGQPKAHVEWFNFGEKDLSAHLGRLMDADAQCVLLVCNPLEGKRALEAMAALEPSNRIPIISHWGIIGGDFFQIAKDLLPKVDLSFLQTCSFIYPCKAEAMDRLYAAYVAKFKDTDSPRSVSSPVGTAQGYEVVMMLAAAVKSANTIDRSKIRSAMEQLGKYEGVIRDYDPPFKPGHHDALDINDMRLARFAEDGAIEPIAKHTAERLEQEADDE